MLETWKNCKIFSFFRPSLKCPIYKVKNSLPKWFLSEHQSQITVASTAQTFRWCQDSDFCLVKETLHKVLELYIEDAFVKKRQFSNPKGVLLTNTYGMSVLIVTTEVLLSCTNPKILLHEVVTLKFLLQWQFWIFFNQDTVFEN